MATDAPPADTEPRGLPQRIVVALIQLGQQDAESREQRRERVLRLVDEARDADLVVLPELWHTGYFAFDDYADDARALDDELFVELGRAAARNAVHLVAGTFIERSERGLTNCAIAFDPDGEMVLTYRKIHLFGYESQESRLLTPGEDAPVMATSIGRIAASTCYDLRFPELFRVFAEQGAEMLIIPAAWPAARSAHWRILLKARAVENLAFVIGCNGAGMQQGVELGGGSMVVSPWGEILGEAGPDAEVLRVTIDPTEVSRRRAEFPALEHRRIRITPPGGGARPSEAGHVQTAG
jgi:predicted amidohydrolase